MQTLTRAFTAPGVNRQGSPGDAEQAHAAAAAARERAEVNAKKVETEDAQRRGLRGSRSLFSPDGGFLGFGGKTTLGG